MATYDLYGFTLADIDKAKNILEAILNIKFDAHDSSYHGERYFRFGDVAGEHFVLRENVDPLDGEPAETAYPEHAILFYVNDTSRSANLQELIAQRAESFILLRHEEI